MSPFRDQLVYPRDFGLSLHDFTLSHEACELKKMAKISQTAIDNRDLRENIMTLIVSSVQNLTEKPQ